MKKKIFSPIKKLFSSTHSGKFISEEKNRTSPEDREKKIREASRKVGQRFERALIRLSER